MNDHTRDMMLDEIDKAETRLREISEAYSNLVTKCRESDCSINMLQMVHFAGESMRRIADSQGAYLVDCLGPFMDEEDEEKNPEEPNA